MKFKDKNKGLIFGGLLIFSTVFSSGCRMFSQEDSSNSPTSRDNSPHLSQEILKAELHAFATLSRNRKTSLENQIYLIEDIINSVNNTSWLKKISLQINLKELQKRIKESTENQEQLFTDLNKAFRHLQSSLELLHQDLNSLFLSWPKHCSSGAGFSVKPDLSTYSQKIEDLFKRPFKTNPFAAMLSARKTKIHEGNLEISDLTSLESSYRESCYRWVETFQNKTEVQSLTNNDSGSYTSELSNNLTFEQLQTKTIDLFVQLKNTANNKALTTHIQETEKIYYFWTQPLLNQTQALISHLFRHRHNYYRQSLEFSESSLQINTDEMNQSLALTLQRLLNRDPQSCSSLTDKGFSTAVHLSTTELSTTEQEYLQERQWHIWQTLKPFCNEVSLWKK